MATYNTIHIFGYGETQLISETQNKKVLSSELSSLQAVIDNVYSHKPEDNNADTSYHAINIFNNMFGDWLPKEKDQKSFRVPYAELDEALISALIAEIEAIPVPTEEAAL